MGIGIGVERCWHRYMLRIGICECRQIIRFIDGLHQKGRLGRWGWFRKEGHTS